MSIEQQLFARKDPQYELFMRKLVPNEPHIIGVRIPALRLMAKEIIKQDPIAFLKTVENRYFEETQLEGFVIGTMKVRPEERIPYVTAFVPKIRNWSVCDGFCSVLKDAKKHQALYWSLVERYAASDQPYEQRFAAVMILNYFVNDTYLEKALAVLDHLKHDDYYVKMGVAWAVSICFIRKPIETMPYLHNNHLDDWTYNKALSKITESLRVSKETKDRIRAMKRKKTP
ncbi:DNA alkylation repair protein [Kurthia massiliensis]|uniref:DNA alkylation repair protein n=1 Tax=Kurthia massiliensis TaxID=1033739 RepID=UPI00028A00C3|nr:DNA alkylation repair protein [Kurthia massiliensis]